jgi:restriction system protein
MQYCVPDSLAGKIGVSGPYQKYNSRGVVTSFTVGLDFHEMGLSNIHKASNLITLDRRVVDTLRNWEKKYQRQQAEVHKEVRTECVNELNLEATEVFESLNNILVHALSKDSAFDWDTIKCQDEFRVEPVELLNDEESCEYIIFDTGGCPTKYEEVIPPIEPTYENVSSEYGVFSKIFRGRHIKEEFESRVLAWKRELENTCKENERRELRVNEIAERYVGLKHDFDEEKKRDNEAVEDRKTQYAAKNPVAIEEYCDFVLGSSVYPDCFQMDWVLQYKEENRMAIVEYDLPSPDQIPAVESYKYIKLRDEISEKNLSQAARKKLYDSVVYQICLRTLHELYDADVVDALDPVVFNGLVTNINPATGIEETKLIMSVVATKVQFAAFDLSLVDPKATFKHMKGVAAVSLVDLTPIPPIVQIEKSDKRFIDGRNVVGNLDRSVNLAAMHWDDFEHLIRELFEKEFVSSGGEVKVTQASSDGGVDAIAFDPDPIRGGKIVIQAKRYTNVVGVASVRDLYGTVMNEGATKGILVTTSHYGGDSYEFAKDKPLTLINGGNLLSLLNKHGYEARINIAEAKKLIKANG